MTLAELNFRPDEIRGLYLVHLQQMYSGEEQLLHALPELAEQISLPWIKAQLLEEAASTPAHLELLKRVLTSLGERPVGPVCRPIEVMIELSQKLAIQHRFGPWRDLLLTAAMLEIKHMNINKYVMAATFARALEAPQQMDAFMKVTREEAVIDHRLRISLRDLGVDLPES